MLSDGARDARIVTMPPAPQYSYVDYWGTHVVAFNVDRNHDALGITGTAVGRHPTARRTARRLRLVRRRRCIPDHDRSSVAQPLHQPRSRARRAARPASGRRGPPTARRVGRHRGRGAALRGGASRRSTRRRTRPSPTGRASVRTLPTCASHWHGRPGLPARDVQGYFHPDADATVGEEITAQSHAWVEFWTGAWWGYDPTSDCPVGSRHVAVGRGRDYADVPPVKGIYAGNAGEHHGCGGPRDEDPMRKPGTEMHQDGAGAGLVRG